jgi:hypothetical protein
MDDGQKRFFHRGDVADKAFNDLKAGDAVLGEDETRRLRGRARSGNETGDATKTLYRPN